MLDDTAIWSPPFENDSIPITVNPYRVAVSQGEVREMIEWHLETCYVKPDLDSQHEIVIMIRRYLPAIIKSFDLVRMNMADVYDQMYIERKMWRQIERSLGRSRYFTVIEVLYKVLHHIPEYQHAMELKQTTPVFPLFENAKGTKDG